MMHTPHVALRLATAQEHERLHHLPAFTALVDGRLDLDGYRRILERMLGFQAPMELAVTAGMGNTSFGLDLSTLRRAPLLREDLGTLGLVDHEMDRLPYIAATNFESPAAAFGALYVMEGATLGGQVLARRLDSLLGTGSIRGRRFLLAGSDSARPAWREVRAALDRCGAKPGHLATMIDSAITTFIAFGAWFATPMAESGNERWATGDD